MTIRFYLIPIERNGARRGPKYFRWPADLNSTAIKCPWSMKDYGLIDQAIIAADISAADHATLASYADVMALPLNLDVHLTAGAVTTARDFLEQYGIPGGWITTADTYRGVLRSVTAMFLYMQRVMTLYKQPITLTGGALNTAMSSVPVAIREAMQKAANEMTYDYGWVTGSTTVRQVLKSMADAWGTRPILFGITTL